MSLLTDPTGEANLFEVVNKIIKERERKEMLMNIESPHQYSKKKDLFLNEREMQERVKTHKQAMSYLNHEQTNIDTQQRNPAYRRNPSNIE